MKSSLALLLGVAFISFLFRLDSKKKRDVSHALWVPTLWAIVIGSRMVSEWLSLGGGSAATPESYADGNPFDRNVFLAMILAAFFIVIKRKVNFGKLVRNNVWLILFLAYCGLSIVWSDFPIVSFKRYFKEVGNFAMALVVLTEDDPLQAIRTLGKRCAYILMPLSIVMYKYYPDLGRSYNRWDGTLSITGVTNNKNSLGVLAAICGILVLSSLLSFWRNSTIRKNKPRLLVQAFILGLCIWIMITAHSATSIGCFVVSTCILTLTGWKNVRRNIAYYLLAVVFVVVVLQASGALVALTAGSLGRDESLTGRTDVWKSVIKLAVNPLIGDGYSSFWLGERMETLWREYSWHPIEAHDGYLEIYLDLGIVGLILLAGVIFSSFRAVLKLFKTDFELGSLLLAILVAALIYNVTESAFRPGLLMYFIFMLSAVRWPRSLKRPGQQVPVTSVQPATVSRYPNASEAAGTNPPPRVPAFNRLHTPLITSVA